MSLVGLLIAVVIVAVILYVVKNYIDPPFQKIAYAVLALFLLLWLIGGLSGHGVLWVR